MDELRSLWDERDQPRPVFPAQTVRRDTVDEVLACVGLPETEQALRERRLPGTGGPDDADGLTGLPLERDVRQRRRLCPLSIRVRRILERKNLERLEPLRSGRGGPFVVPLYRFLQPLDERPGLPHYLVGVLRL